METTYDKRYKVIKKYTKRLDGENLLTGRFIHYTSIDSVFAILDGDSFWAANVRFSNDAMEERMLKLDGMEDRDDYIVCFCTQEDILSQWRGYCHNGGAAIQLNLNYTQEYSILHADYDSSGNFVLYDNTPLPVIYLNPDDHSSQVKGFLKSDINSCGYVNDILLEDMLPYFKNGHFKEEREARMVFSNTEGTLSKCIRFRTLLDGVKVPYIVVKYGNMGKMKGACNTDISQYNDQRIEMLSKNREPIWIDEGYDQESKYYEMVKRVEDFRKGKGWTKPISILCKGKLPVVKIIVAPTYDRERKAEQIRRFCQSKYWLKNVRVEVSDIPYIQPLL